MHYVTECPQKDRHTENVCDDDDELFRKLSDLLKFSPF